MPSRVPDADAGASPRGVERWVIDSLAGTPGATDRIFCRRRRLTGPLTRGPPSIPRAVGNLAGLEETEPEEDHLTLTYRGETWGHE